MMRMNNVNEEEVRYTVSASTSDNSSVYLIATTINHKSRAVKYDEIVIKGSDLSGLRTKIVETVENYHWTSEPKRGNWDSIIDPNLFKDEDKMINIDILKDYLEKEDEEIRKEFIHDLLRAISLSSEGNLKKNIKDLISTWAETAEICLDEALMEDIRIADEELASTRGISWTPPKNIM